MTCPNHTTQRRIMQSNEPTARQRNMHAEPHAVLVWSLARRWMDATRRRQGGDDAKPRNQPRTHAHKLRHRHSQFRNTQRTQQQQQQKSVPDFQVADLSVYPVCFLFCVAYPNMSIDHRCCCCCCWCCLLVRQENEFGHIFASANRRSA